jgi:hypothetical protein
MCFLLAIWSLTAEILACFSPTGSNVYDKRAGIQQYLQQLNLNQIPMVSSIDTPNGSFQLDICEPRMDDEANQKLKVCLWHLALVASIGLKKAGRFDSIVGTLSKT